MWLLILTAFAVPASTLTGYDCGGSHINITTISLLEPNQCEIPDTQPNVQDVYLQLLQLTDFRKTQAIQCRIEIDRTVYYCGMHSHVSILEHGRQSYIREVSREACEQLHREGILTITPTKHLTNIQQGTTRMEATLAGKLDADGKCEGEFFDDRYGQWSNAVVQAIIRITLSKQDVVVKLDSDKVIFANGLSCALNKRSCFDEEGGNSYWDDIPHHTCDFAQYDVLYEGHASKITEKDNLQNLTIFSLTSEDVTFGLVKTSELQLCGHTIFKTEHPKLFVFQTTPGNTFKKVQPMLVENVDIFTYVNSKFVYVEKHLKTQMTNLYQDIVKQRCELETQVLRHALTLATLSPDEFAYNLLKEPGHMAVVAGEVIHIIKCIPVAVKIRETKECYIELPVTVRNETYFLTPKSKLLIKNGMERECDRILAPMYKIDGQWYKFTPHPIEAMPPQILHPNDRMTWTYTQPQALSISGVYRQTDLDKLKEHILFPTERMGILSNMARGATGHEISKDGISLYNLFDEDTLNRIAQSTSQRIWAGFITFGSASAGFLGIFIIIRVIKFIVDTIIHGYTIYDIYGWSIHLVGALWSSLTHLLTHLARPTAPEAPESNKEEEIIVALQPQATYEELHERLRQMHGQPHTFET